MAVDPSAGPRHPWRAGPSGPIGSLRAIGGNAITPTRRGWIYVAIQAVLLVAMVLLPGRDDWPTTGAVGLVSISLVAAGVTIGIAASLQLGRSLTPTPVPRADGRLTVSGAYRFVRHPIYTAVLTAVAGLAIGSGSWISAAFALVTVAFFHHKAAWEEAQLAERYDDYSDYAARTPRFVPRPWRIGRPGDEEHGAAGDPTRS